MEKYIEIFLSLLVVIICIFLNVWVEGKELIIINILNINIFYLAYKLRERKKNIMIFYFVVCNFIFNTSIATTQLIENKYILESMFFTYYTPFSIEITKFVYNILIINNMGILLGILVVAILKEVKNFNRNFKAKKICINLLEIFFWIIIGYVFIENIEQIKEAMKIGYVNLYKKDKIKNLSYYAIIIFNYIIIIYMSLKPKYNKRMKSILIAGVILYFSFSLKGSRADFLIFFLFLVWNLEVLEYFKIKKRYALIIVFLIFIYSEILNVFRSNYGSLTKEKYKFERMIDYPARFLISQNGTSKMIGYIKEFPEIIENENYGKMIFSSFWSFYDSIFRKELLKTKNGRIDSKLGVMADNFSRISYIVNPELTREGYGLGGNYIVEMYEVGGKIGVLLLSFLHIILIFYMENLYKRDKKIYLNIFVVLVFKEIFYAPRSYYFQFSIKEYIYICIVFFVILCVAKCIKERENEENIKKNIML